MARSTSWPAFQGPASRTAIGWVIFGVLRLAAVFTLFLTPAVYMLVARLSKPRASASKDLAQQMRESERML